MLKKNWAFADWWLFVFFNYATWSIVQNLVCSLDCLCSIHYALPNMFCLVVKIHNVVKINKTSNLFTILYFQLFLCKDINEDCDHFMVPFRSSFHVFHFMGILLSINIVVKQLNSIKKKNLKIFSRNSPPFCQGIRNTN